MLSFKCSSSTHSSTVLVWLRSWSNLAQLSDDTVTLILETYLSAVRSTPVSFQFSWHIWGCMTHANNVKHTKVKEAESYDHWLLCSCWYRSKMSSSNKAAWTSDWYLFCFLKQPRWGINGKHSEGSAHPSHTKNNTAVRTLVSNRPPLTSTVAKATEATIGLFHSRHSDMSP